MDTVFNNLRNLRNLRFFISLRVVSIRLEYIKNEAFQSNALM